MSPLFHARIEKPDIDVRFGRGWFVQEAVHRLNSADHSSDASLKLGAQSLSNMLYAYALLNHHPGTQLLSAIAKGVQWQLRDFSPQVGARRRCTGSCLAASCPDTIPTALCPLSYCGTVQSYDVMRLIHPQGLSNTVWSLAKLGAELNQDISHLLDAISSEAVSQLRDVRARAKFIPQNLSNMRVRLQSSFFGCPRQVQALEPQQHVSAAICVSWRISYAGCQQKFGDKQLDGTGHVWNRRLYGFAQLGVQPSPVLLEAVALEARRQLLAFGPQVDCVAHPPLCCSSTILLQLLDA